MTRYVRFKKGFEYVVYEEASIKNSGNAFLPSTAMVPFLQHQGQAAHPIVHIGDRVSEGQIIARGSGDASTHVHSPIPGTVREFRAIPLPDGSKSEAAIIDLSGTFSILGRREENFPWKNLGQADMLRILEERGLINTFDSSSPLVPQLRRLKDKPKRALILRLFDNDPTCQLDSLLARDQLDRVLEGTAILGKAIEASAVFLVTVDRGLEKRLNADWSALFGKSAVRVLRAPNRYPAGTTEQLHGMAAALDASIDPSSTILIDPVTALAALDAIVHNRPLIDRFVLVSGPAINETALLRVKIGTPIGDVIDECGGFRSTPSRIIVNGLLTGKAVYDLDTPITKTTKSLLFIDRDSCPEASVTACVHCGRCMQVCPVSIDPMRLVHDIRKNAVTQADAKSIGACHYCGCCAIVCPSRIPLHHIIKIAATADQGEKK